MGRLLIIAGLILVAIGIILHFAPWLLNWFGRLPGDIRIVNERTKIYIPITSMILLSLLLTLLINLVKR